MLVLFVQNARILARLRSRGRLPLVPAGTAPVRFCQKFIGLSPKLLPFARVRGAVGGEHRLARQAREISILVLPHGLWLEYPL